MTLLLRLAWLLAALFWTPALASADAAETHDGFMLRLAIGPGGGTLSSGSSALYGGAGSFSLDIGGALSDSITLHARLASFVLVDPELELAGVTYSTTDVSFIQALLAPALTFNFGTNLYLTGAIGLCEASLEVAGQRGVSETGVGVNLDFGKEWWVSSDWGLGLAGRLWLAHFDDDDESSAFGGLAVLFSATYQ